MKLPSSVGDGIVPSGRSFAFTYPGVLGSRTGGPPARAGRGVGAGKTATPHGPGGAVAAGVWAIAGPVVATPRSKAKLRNRDMEGILSLEDRRLPVRDARKCPPACDQPRNGPLRSPPEHRDRIRDNHTP